MDKKIMIPLFIFILFSILPVASAVRISPGRAILQFEPGLDFNFTFHVTSDKNYDCYHLVDVLVNNSDIGQYIDWKGTVIEEFEPLESRGYTFSIKMPEELEPGDHYLSIIAHSTLSPEQLRRGQSMAYAKVVVDFIVRVPYPGLYAKIDKIECSPILEMGKEHKFVALIHNYGNQNISTATAEVNIINPFNKTIFTTLTNTESLNSAEIKKLYAYWTPKDVPLGKYEAEMELRYDGGNTYLKRKEFAVGDELIEITAIPHLELAKDTIKSVQFSAKSFWSEMIDNVYIEVELEDKKFKSQSVSFKPLEEKNITAFIDPTGIEPGEYNAKATLYYGNKTDTEEFDVVITSISKALLYGISGIILTLIIVLAIIFFFLKGKH